MLDALPHLQRLLPRFLSSLRSSASSARSVIHFFFSWFTAPGFLPDPFWRVFLKNGHRSKHGSDTGVYDSEGRFIPAKFEEIFSKCVARRDWSLESPAHTCLRTYRFDKGNKGGLTFWEGVHMIHAQRQAVDPIGWCAEAFEWASTYLLSQSALENRSKNELLLTALDFPQSGRRMACVCSTDPVPAFPLGSSFR